MRSLLTLFNCQAVVGVNHYLIGIDAGGTIERLQLNACTRCTDSEQCVPKVPNANTGINNDNCQQDCFQTEYQWWPCPHCKCVDTTAPATTTAAPATTTAAPATTTAAPATTTAAPATTSGPCQNYVVGPAPSQGITEDQCAQCDSGTQTWWPCDKIGDLCICSDGSTLTPTPTTPPPTSSGGHCDAHCSGCTRWCKNASAGWTDRCLWASTGAGDCNMATGEVTGGDTGSNTGGNNIGGNTGGNTGSNSGGNTGGKCGAASSGCTYQVGVGVASWFNETMFNNMFPHRTSGACSTEAPTMLDYSCLIWATQQPEFAGFANSGIEEDDKRELAAWMGIMSQETTGGGCSPPGRGSEAAGTCACSSTSWCDGEADGGCSRWGLCFVVEAGGTYCSQSSRTYPCKSGKSYKGRGPKQLSYNYNYGQFSEFFCGDKDILLDYPDRVGTNPQLAWASSMWFWMTGGACGIGERCKPSPHSVFTGTKTMCSADTNAGRKYGLGWATNVVNGGLECGSGGGECDYRVHSRARFYKHFCDIMNVDALKAGWTNENLYCKHQKNYAESAPTIC